MSPYLQHTLAASSMAALLIAATTACSPTGADDHRSQAAAPPPRRAPVVVQDVFERDDKAIVGIAYPPGIARYPLLAEALREHALEARAKLDQALSTTPGHPVPFELSMRFTTLADCPHLVAVVAEEELYTGGRVSVPARKAFVWSPQQQRLLMPDELVAGPDGWVALDRYVASVRRAAAPPKSAPVVREVVPMLNSQGHIIALRVLSDEGDVDVPAGALKPVLSPALSPWLG